jgi:hypothetical protein
MCRRFLNFMPIFAATLSIGIAVVFGFERLFLPVTELTSLEKFVEPVRTWGPQVDLNNESLAVEYDCSLMGVDTLSAIFTVTHTGVEPISFDVDELTEKFPARLTDASGELSLDVSAEATKRELLPGDSAWLWVDVPLDSSPFDFSFRYRFSNSLRTRTAFVSVGSQVKSYTCNAQEYSR